MTSPAGFWVRLLATIIDTILFSLLRWVLGFILLALHITREPTEEQKSMLEALAKNGANPAEILGATLNVAHQGGVLVSSGLFIVLSLGIVFFFITKKGGTPGKLALGLRIQETATHQHPSFWRAVIREVVGKYVLWSITLGIGALMVAFNKKKRGLHDIVSGTEVVKLQEG